MSDVTLPFGHKRPPEAPARRVRNPPGKARWPIPLAICVGMIAAQWFPPTGIVLMLVGGPLWSIVLVNVTLVLMIADALCGASPKWLLGLPVAAYLANAAAFGVSLWQVMEIKSQVEAGNGGKHLLFDPAKEAILVDRGIANQLVSRYRLGVVYSPKAVTDPGVGRYYAARAVLNPSPSPTCLGGRGDTLLTRPAMISGVVVTNICVLSRPEDLPLPMIVVSARQKTIARGLASATVTELTLQAPDGRTATYSFGEASVLSPIPLPMIGCALSDAANSWQCMAQLLRWPVTIGPQKLGLVGGGEVEAGIMGTMLGLTPRTATVTRPARFMDLPTGFADPTGIEPISAAAALGQGG